MTFSFFGDPTLALHQATKETQTHEKKYRNNAVLLYQTSAAGADLDNFQGGGMSTSGM